MVTRKGQTTTIPVTLRRKYGISKDTKLRVEDTGTGVIFRKVPTTLDMVGSGARRASIDEMKKLSDGTRTE